MYTLNSGRSLTAFLLLTLIGFTFSADNAAAQTSIGYIDSERIFEEYDEFKLARQRFEQETRDAENEIAIIEARLDSMRNEKDKGRFTWSASRLEEKEAEISAKQDEVREQMQTTFGPGGTIYNLQRELTEKAMEDIVFALNQVAEDEGYDMIFDAAGGLIPFKKEENDLTDKVLVELRKGQSRD